MPDVDAFESAYGRLAATRVAEVARETEVQSSPRPSAHGRSGALRSPLLKRLALLAPARVPLRGPHD